MGGRVSYFKKPVVEFESDRQCIWTDSTGKRCENKAQGYFFCKEHFKLAGNIDSCGYTEYDSAIIR
jgi:hypothetical protein